MNNKLPHLSWHNITDQEQITELLKNDIVVAGSSDTILGLLANTTTQGHAELNRIKERAEKSYIVLIADKTKLDRFVLQPASTAVQKLMTHCWPGPLTLILKADEALPDYLKAHDGTIALRVPKHAGLLSVLKKFDGLFSTSANKYGKPVALTAEELDPSIASQVTCVVVDENKTKNLITPSTIIDCSGENLRVVREGAYLIEELELVCGVPLR